MVNHLSDRESTNQRVRLTKNCRMVDLQTPDNRYPNIHYTTSRQPFNMLRCLNRYLSDFLCDKRRPSVASLFVNRRLSERTSQKGVALPMADLYARCPVASSRSQPTRFTQHCPPDNEKGIENISPVFYALHNIKLFILYSYQNTPESVRSASPCHRCRK